MKKRLIHSRIIAVIFLVLLMQSCYTYRVNAPEKVGVTEPHSETLWSIGWGLVQERPDVECHGQALSEVVIQSNLLYDLFTVATLGFASPKKVEWKCSAPDPEPETFEIPTDSTGGN